MKGYIFNTYKDNPPEGVHVMAEIELADGGKANCIVYYIKEGDVDFLERQLNDGAGNILGRVLKWRFLTESEKERYNVE